MIKTIKSGNTNCYLLQDSCKQILIDAGTRTDKEFINKLRQKTPIEKIDLLILTHGHYDHVGYAALLQKKYGIPIAMHKADIHKVASGKMEFPEARGAISNIVRTFTLKEMDKAIYEAFMPDIVYEHEQNVAGTNLKVIPVSGHTVGSIGVQQDGNLFVGDLMMNIFFPSNSWFAEDFKMLNQSIEKIKKLSIKQIYPSHGKNFSADWIR